MKLANIYKHNDKTMTYTAVALAFPENLVEANEFNLITMLIFYASIVFIVITALNYHENSK